MLEEQRRGHRDLVFAVPLLNVVGPEAEIRRAQSMQARYPKRARCGFYHTPREFADDAGVLDCTSEPPILRVRRVANREEDIRVDEDVLVSR